MKRQTIKCFLVLCALVLVVTCAAACNSLKFDPTGIPGIAIIGDSFHGNVLAKLNEGNVLFVYTEDGDVYNPVEDKYERGYCALVIYYSGSNIKIQKYTAPAYASTLNSAYNYAARIRESIDVQKSVVSHDKRLEKAYYDEAEAARQIKVVKQDYSFRNDNAGYVIVRCYATVYEMNEKVVIVFETESHFVPGFAIPSLLEDGYNERAKNENAGVMLSLLQGDEKIKQYFPMNNERNYIRPLCAGAFVLSEEGSGLGKNCYGIGWSYNNFAAPKNLPSLDKTEKPAVVNNVIIIETTNPNYGGSVDVEVRVKYKAGGKNMDKAFTVNIPLKNNDSEWIIG